MNSLVSRSDVRHVRSHSNLNKRYVSGVQVKFRCDPAVIAPGCAMALDSADILALMSVLYSDTHPKIEQMQIEFIRRMPTWGK